MNKQRYLAELQRLLVFMTETDRSETVRRYSDLFDETGPDGEAELIAQLGSPTKAAIALSRGYEPGKLPAALPGAPERPQKQPANLTQTQADPWGDLPTFDMPEFIDELLPQETEAAPDKKDKSFSMPDLPGRSSAGQSVEKAPEIVRGIPLALGIPLFVIVFLGIGVPLALLCIALIVVMLIPGSAILFCSYLIAVGGLWCLSFMADAILLFGAAFVVLAFGLIVLFAGIWLDVNMASLYLRGVRWVAGELLGRRSSNHE